MTWYTPWCTLAKKDAVMTGVFLLRGADEIVAFGFGLHGLNRLTESASEQIIQVDFTDLCPFCYANFKVFAESQEELLGGQRFFLLQLICLNVSFLSRRQLGWWCFFFPTENSEAKKFCVCKVSWNCFKTRICQKTRVPNPVLASITCVGFVYQTHFLWHGFCWFCKAAGAVGTSEEIICLAHQHHSLERTDHWNLASYDCREYLLWHTSVPRPCWARWDTNVFVDHNNQRIQRSVFVPEKTCQKLRGRDITIHLISVISGLGIGGFAYEDYATLVQDLVRVMGMPENRASVFGEYLHPGSIWYKDDITPRNFTCIPKMAILKRNPFSKPIPVSFRGCSVAVYFLKHPRCH